MRSEYISFKFSLEENINPSLPLKTKQQLDDEMELFVTNIQQAA